MDACKTQSLRPGLHQLAGTVPAINSLAPAHNAAAESSVRAASDAAVVFYHPSLVAWYTSTHQGRTRPPERIIEYEQVTAWEARFSSNNLKENYHVLSAAVGTGRFNGHAHKSPPL